MLKKYKIAEVQICTFTLYDDGLIKPNLNDYPIARLCVIDTERNIAIDVRHGLMYDYLETYSMISFINGASEKVKQNKRAAIFPRHFFGFYNPDDEIKVYDIIDKLEKGYKFIDGNDLYSNEEYLKLVAQEREEERQKIMEKKITSKE